MSGKMMVALLLSLVLLGGCASQTGWAPTVDTYGYNQRELDKLARDEAECRELAYRASGGTPEETAKGALVGGAIGAATGAALGAIVGDPGTGAAIGAATGGVTGGTAMGVQAEERYKSAFAACMRGRGHQVLY